MLRHCFFLLGLMAATTLSGGGCRSCSDCHDYDPPVAGCDCNGYGQRTGSASACGTSGGCGCGSCGGGNSGGYYEGQPGPSQQYAEPAPEEVGT